MAERQITDARNLVAEVTALGAAMRERRRHDRRSLLWTATIEVRGKRFEGTIVDLSPGGARLRFDAALTQGDELNLILKELDVLGGRVVWQREGEAGIQFMLAPEEITARIERKLGLDLRRSATPAAPSETLPPVLETRSFDDARAVKKRRLIATTAAALAVIVVGGAVVARGSGEDGIKEAFAITGGAVGQHDCSTRLDKLAGSTNQIDFSLNVASAVHSKCLDLKQITGGESDRNGHMVQATKVRPH
ncbi:MAG TPA: PilZ domain-containing protein [Stellaceae bacterium]|nr:PilZ domain-containing protein [Stellaceae bacterium]